MQCREKTHIAEFDLREKVERRISGFQPGMGAVAKGGFFTVLAPAPSHLLFIFNFHLDGGNIRSSVGTVAKWLSF